MVCAGFKPKQTRFGAPLGPHTKQFLRDARRAMNRNPFEIPGISGNRRVVTALRVDHFATVHMFPDRLVGVGIAPARNVLVAMEDAVLEGAESLQLLHPGLDL